MWAEFIWINKHPFKVLPLGSYALMPAPSPPFKKNLELVLWNGLQTAFVLLLMSSVSSKCLPFNIYLSSGTEKSHWGLDPMKRGGVRAQLFVY
jgi:hypothetical protein